MQEIELKKENEMLKQQAEVYGVYGVYRVFVSILVLFITSICI